MTNEIETFYDDFSRRFVEDIVLRNERIREQLAFFAAAIPVETTSVLVVGFGSGEAAHHIAAKVATQSHVLAVDISAKNLRIARTLFDHPRIEYRKTDFTMDLIEGIWEVIVLPDVYEHIPLASRGTVNAKLNELMGPGARILITVPSPGKQESLSLAGHGLQVVDEVVRLDDLLVLADAVGGELSYFRMISVWETNDYLHAVVERGAGHVTELTKSDRIPLKGWPKRSVWRRGWDFLGNRLRLTKMSQAIARRRINRRLSVKDEI